MSRQFERVADRLIAAGATDETLHRELAEMMDMIGVPFLSFSRYADQPAIVRLFGERGVTFASDKATAAAAVKAPSIREKYAPGKTPMPGED